MPNATGHFVLVSDTSNIGCGAALYQKQKGKYHLIARNYQKQWKGIALVNWN